MPAEIFKDKKGEWRFHVEGKNGEIVATSEGYASAANARRGLNTLRNICLIDLADSHEVDRQLNEEASDEEPDLPAPGA